MNFKIRKLYSIGDLEVWEVDGTKIRKKEPDFTDYGEHFKFNFIPIHELWVDKEKDHKEDIFYIIHSLTERRLMSSGVPYDEAYDIASHVERAERFKSDKAKHILKGGTKRDVKIKKLITYKNIDVWIVDGEAVRDIWFPDFTFGGHYKVYEFIDKNEIWIDNKIMGKEVEFTLLHEYLEMRLMEKNWTYDDAHQAALNEEWKVRNE